MLAGAIETLRQSPVNATLKTVSSNAVPPPSSPSSSSSLYGATQTIRTLLERKATAIAAKVKQRLTEEQRLIIVAILSSSSSSSLSRSSSSRSLKPSPPPPTSSGAGGTPNEDMMMDNDEDKEKLIDHNNEDSEGNDEDDAWGMTICSCRTPPSSSSTKRRKKNSVSRLNADLKALLEPFLSEAVGPCLAAIEGRIEDTFGAYRQQRTDSRGTSDDDGLPREGCTMLLDEVHESVRVAVQLYAVAVAAIRKAIEGPLIAAMTDAPTTLAAMANTSLLTAASSTATITASPMEADRLAQRALRRFRSACAELLWISNDKNSKCNTGDDDTCKKDVDDSNTRDDDAKKDHDVSSLVQAVLVDGIARRGVCALLTRHLSSPGSTMTTTEAAKNTETTTTTPAMRHRCATEAFVLPLLAAAAAETITDPQLLLLKKQTTTVVAATDDGDKTKDGKSIGGGGNADHDERNDADRHSSSDFSSIAQWIRSRFVPFWTLLPRDDDRTNGNMLAIASKNKKKENASSEEEKEEEALDHEMKLSDSLSVSVWRAVDHRVLSLALHRRWPFLAAAGEAAANLGDAFDTLHTLIHPRQVESEEKGREESNDDNSEQHQLQRLLSDVRGNLRRPLQEMVHVARLRVAQHVYTLLLSARPEQKTDHGEEVQKEEENDGAGAAVDTVRRGAAAALVNAAWQLLCFSGGDSLPPPSSPSSYPSNSGRCTTVAGSRLVALFNGQKEEGEEKEEKEEGNNKKATNNPLADTIVHELRSVIIQVQSPRLGLFRKSSSRSSILGPLFAEVLDGLQHIQGLKADDELLTVLFIFDCLVALTATQGDHHQLQGEQKEEDNVEDEDNNDNNDNILWRARFRQTVTILRQHLRNTCKNSTTRTTLPSTSTPRQPQEDDEQTAAVALRSAWGSLWHGYHRRYQQQQQKICSVIPACNGKNQKKNEDEEKKNGSCGRTRFLSAMSQALNELMNAAATIPASV